MAQYGDPPARDTVSVCQTWTGSDYVTRVDVLGSADWNATATDTVANVQYQSGTVAGYAKDGSPMGTMASGPTSFDFMVVDSASRQASIDDPYYALQSSGDGSTCVPNPNQACPLSSTQSDGKFTKHGLTRRGVRALVDNMAEIGRGTRGERRFRKLRGDEDVILSIDDQTQLLVAEETKAAKHSSKAVHTWVPTAGGFVHERTDIEDTDTIDGKKVTSRAVITFRDVVIQ